MVQSSHLVDKGSPERVLIVKDLGPQLDVSPPHEVPGLRLEERVLVADVDQLSVALASLVGDARQVRVALLAVAADNLAVVEVVLPAKTVSELSLV